MKNSKFKCKPIMIKSFLTSVKAEDVKTIKGGRLEDTSDSVVTCDTNYNCTKYACEER